MYQCSNAYPYNSIFGHQFSYFVSRLQILADLKKKEKNFISKIVRICHLVHCSAIQYGLHRKFTWCGDDASNLNMKSEKILQR